MVDSFSSSNTISINNFSKNEITKIENGNESQSDEILLSNFNNFNQIHNEIKLRLKESSLLNKLYINSYLTENSLIDQIKTYKLWSGFNLLSCLWLGFIALFYSMKTLYYKKHRNMEYSLEASKNARM